MCCYVGHYFYFQKTSKLSFWKNLLCKGKSEFSLLKVHPLRVKFLINFNARIFHGMDLPTLPKILEWTSLLLNAFVKLWGKNFKGLMAVITWPKVYPFFAIFSCCYPFDLCQNNWPQKMNGKLHCLEPKALIFFVPFHGLHFASWKSRMTNGSKTLGTWLKFKIL